jgi:hypothetical protein
MLLEVEDVPGWDMLPEDTEMVDVEQVVRREERKNDAQNFVRVQEMSIDEEVEDGALSWLGPGELARVFYRVLGS